MSGKVRAQRDARRRFGKPRLPGEPATPIPVQRGRFRRLATNRALWHSGGPIRRANGPRDSGDLGFLQAWRGRRAENQSRACHRAQFVTNLRAAPCEPPPEGVLVNGLTESEASDGEKSPKSEKLGSRGLSFSSKTPGRQFGTGARGGIWAVGPSDFGDFSPLGRVLLAVRSCPRVVSRLVASLLCRRAFRGNAPRARAVRYDAPIRYDMGKGPA